MEDQRGGGPRGPEHPLSGTFTFTTVLGGTITSSGNGTFDGSLTGNTLTINFAGQDTAGDTCRFTWVITANL